MGPIHIRSLAELLLTWRRQRVRAAPRRTNGERWSRSEQRVIDRYDDLVAAEYRNQS
jgi:hypothetical protein